MRHRTVVAGITALLLAAAPALADDKTECQSGIRMIKAQIAKKPSKPVLDKLQQALKTAEQEVIEGDWDECVAAVKEARRALQK